MVNGMFQSCTMDKRGSDDVIDKLAPNGAHVDAEHG